MFRDEFQRDVALVHVYQWTGPVDVFIKEVTKPNVVLRTGLGCCVQRASFYSCEHALNFFSGPRHWHVTCALCSRVALQPQYERFCRDNRGRAFMTSSGGTVQRNTGPATITIKLLL